MIRIEVLGSPAPKGNARAFVNKSTGRAILSSFGSGGTEKRLRSWDAAVREAARDQVELGNGPVFVKTPLSVGLVFRISRPAGHWGKGKNASALKASAPLMPTTKPDADKLTRATLDPLHGIVFDDDSSIVELMVRKEYARPGNEGVLILVEECRLVKERTDG